MKLKTTFAQLTVTTSEEVVTVDELKRYLKEKMPNHTNTEYDRGVAHLISAILKDLG